MKKKLKHKYKKALKKYRKQTPKENPSGMYWHYEDPSDGQWFIGYLEDGHPALV